MKDIAALITLLAIAAGALFLTGCASGRDNVTYAAPPSDNQGRQTPHSIP